MVYTVTPCPVPPPAPRVSFKFPRAELEDKEEKSHQDDALEPVGNYMHLEAPLVRFISIAQYHTSSSLYSRSLKKEKSAHSKKRRQSEERRGSAWVRPALPTFRPQIGRAHV